LRWFEYTSLANDLDKARAIEKKTNKTMHKAQANVDANVEASFTLQSEIEQLETQIENLTLYRNHLRKLVTSQNTELDSLEQQLKDIEDTRQGIVPLMYRMIDGLESVLTSDVPIRQEAR
jgi:chromosome segregation ATPase